MLKIVKRISLTSAIAAAVFMVIQVLADLYLPTLTSNIIDKGSARRCRLYLAYRFCDDRLFFDQYLSCYRKYIFATRESQKLGKQLRTDVYKNQRV